MTKSLIIAIIGFILLFLIFSGLEISFKPFKIELPHWRFAVGIVLMIIGSFFVYYEGVIKGQDRGMNKTIEFIEKGLNNMEDKK